MMKWVRIWFTAMLLALGLQAQAATRVTIVTGEVGPPTWGPAFAFLLFMPKLRELGYPVATTDPQVPPSVSVGYYSRPDLMTGSGSNRDFLTVTAEAVYTQTAQAMPGQDRQAVLASNEYRAALGAAYAGRILAVGLLGADAARAQYGADGVRVLRTVHDLATRIQQRFDSSTNGVRDQSVYIGLQVGSWLLGAVEAYLWHLGSGDLAARGVRFIQDAEERHRVADLESSFGSNHDDELKRTLSRAIATGALSVRVSTTSFPAAGMATRLEALRDPRIPRAAVVRTSWNVGDGSPTLTHTWSQDNPVPDGIVITYFQPGTYTFTLTETHLGGQEFVASGTVVVTGLAAPPTPAVSSVAPLTAAAGASVAITVTGSNLPTTVAMRLAGQSCTRTSHTASQAMFSCVAGSAGTASLVVLTQTAEVSGGEQTLPGGSRDFTVTSASPQPTVVSEVTPPMGTAGTTVRMVVTGTGLPLTMVLTLDSQSCTPVSRSATQASYDCALGSSPGGVSRSLWTDTAGNGGTEIMFSETGFLITTP